MSTIFTMPGKMGDALHQWPIVHHWIQRTQEQAELWMDEKTCAPLVPLFAFQPNVSAAKLVGGVENYNCGGQPFHMSLPTSAFEGNTIYHLGYRNFPIRQLTLETAQSSKVPIHVKAEEWGRPSLEVPSLNGSRANRVVLHGQAFYTHTKNTPTFWKFVSGIRADLESLFDEVSFVGTERDLEVAARTYPDWKCFNDEGSFLTLAGHIAGSKAMIGCGSAPIVLAGLLGIPGIRVHDPIANNAPKVIWSNLGENQLNDTELELRKDWPKWRDRWLLEKSVDPEPAGA